MHYNDITEEFPVCIDPTEGFPELEDAISKWTRTNYEQISDELIDSVAAQEDKHSDNRHIFPESHISYAIDPENADEVDDAIAYCEQEQAFFIHLSDVTRYVSPEGKFNRFFYRALKNKCSMYLPSLTYDMFPARLNRQILSLGAPLSDGSVITIRLRSKAVHGEKRIRGVTTHPKSPFLVDIFLGRIPPPRKLTYEQAASIIQNGEIHQDGNLCILYNAFRDQFPNRMWKVNGDDTYVKVSTSDLEQEEDIGSVHITTYTQMRSDSPVRSLLTGMMSQAHEATGMFNKRRCAGLVQLRQNLSGFRGRIRQITSPMRRAEDLLNHCQIKENLRGRYCDQAEIFMEEHRDEIREFRKVLRDADAELKVFWKSFASN